MNVLVISGRSMTVLEILKQKTAMFIVKNNRHIKSTYKNCNKCISVNTGMMRFTPECLYTLNVNNLQCVVSAGEDDSRTAVKVEEVFPCSATD